MIQYICDYCKTSYEASLSLESVSYFNGKKRYDAEEETEPCFTCKEKADKAGKEVLERIRLNKKEE